MIKLNDFDYHLPPELIAQNSCTPRDHSRLLVLNRAQKTWEHRKFFELTDFLKAGDVLVFNNSKVFPARLRGIKTETGGGLEILLLRPTTGRKWQAIVGGKGKHEGLKLTILNKKSQPTKLQAVLKQPVQDMVWELEFNFPTAEIWGLLERYGWTPTPPYVKKITRLAKYQTVYAEKVGSVAAPTAGFHFTPRLLKKIKALGIQCEFVTLHVGPGTFAPIREGNVSTHQMHSEWIEVSKEVAARLNQARKEKRRIIAVGTTAARTLEAAGQSGQIKALSAWTDIFIYPGYEFKVLDGLVTNFHLPKSSLLVLVSALAGRELILKAYTEAVKEKYRFYSFGDAMLIV